MAFTVTVRANKGTLVYFNKCGFVWAMFLRACDFVGISWGSWREGWDHRSDYCSCVIAQTLACDQGEWALSLTIWKGDQINLKAWLQAMVHLKVNVLYLSINYLIIALSAQGCLPKGVQGSGLGLYVCLMFVLPCCARPCEVNMLYLYLVLIMLDWTHI